ncbi:MAG TPA: DPP IV N-terminal domain-containing protein, partial [Acidobacteriota bacterium]|nr:DPP IV N-terminal domain-containing protein [Acidobacteriota bacterium]
MNRVPRTLFFFVVALMTLALVGNPLAGTAMAAPQQEQQRAVAAVSAKPEGSDLVWGEANWQLANRFASYKMRDLSYSTSVSPVWIEGTDDNFWYSYETSAGREFILVDPAAGTKAPIFDNDRIAAELTRITKDPYDGQHLPITSIRFMDPDTIQFDVTSSQDEEKELEEETEGDQQDDTEDEGRGGRAEKKVHHFEYTVSTRTLRELDTWEEPDSHPGWANVSPDEQWVVFGRHFNLYMMSYEDYEKIVDARRGKSGQEAEDAENEVEVTEIQLTDDGVEHYGYVGGGRGQTDNDREENKDDRMRPGITWAHDSSRFAMLRSDRREVGDLWVVHVIGNDRPELESYKYDLPGEENVSQRELVLFDMASREMSKIEDANIWRDQ